MSKPHLILIPGLLCDAAVWEHQVRELASIAHLTISDHGDLDSITAMADAILDHAPEQFAIAGHSMGGRVAFQVYHRAPERITGIALLDTASTPRPAGAEGENEAQQRRRLVKKAKKEGMRAMGAEWMQPMVHPARLADGQLTRAILEMIERKTPEIFEAQIKALIDRPDARPVLRQIRCPALVLCGRQDTWSTLPHHEEMAALIPNSRLVVIENCGHMSTMECPADVTAAMHEWLTSL